jgi:hypothetical protein
MLQSRGVQGQACQGAMYVFYIRAAIHRNTSYPSCASQGSLLTHILSRTLSSPLLKGADKHTSFAYREVRTE